MRCQVSREHDPLRSRGRRRGCGRTPPCESGEDLRELVVRGTVCDADVGSGAGGDLPLTAREAIIVKARIRCSARLGDPEVIGDQPKRLAVLTLAGDVDDVGEVVGWASAPCTSFERRLMAPQMRCHLSVHSPWRHNGPAAPSGVWIGA